MIVKWEDTPNKGSGYYFCYEPMPVYKDGPDIAEYIKSIVFVDGQLAFYGKGRVCLVGDFPDDTKWYKVDMLEV